ncbi:hypothetical protein EBU94_01665 [bacterium]|nr:hypothetical protein [bacterium]
MKHIQTFENFLNEAKIDPKVEQIALDIISNWEDSGFRAEDLHQKQFLDRAINDYQVAYGIKVTGQIRNAIKELLKK